MGCTTVYRAGCTEWCVVYRVAYIEHSGVYRFRECTTFEEREARELVDLFRPCVSR